MMLGIDPALEFEASAAEWMTAIGTVGAVLVALFGPVLWSWWRRPRLKITYKPAEPFCRDNVPLEGGALAHWIRVMVTNEGRSTAKRCKGQVIKVVRQEDNSVRSDIDPLPLRWAGVPEGQEMNPRDLSPKESQYLNVAMARTDNQNAVIIATDLSGDFRPGFSPTLEAGRRHKITVAVYADNADPVTAEFVITFDGDIHSLRMEAI